ncbi:hypothetical protein P8C59_007422 [Phyllachora maydis]|uniref:Uncharacterized protein n=1 Tax=Phyllachora maydis TaxID=1825666 RepID=A0AAD9I8E5_9PEZI|nr:hypothetical protein P8C59_007422 [Phyllachora maydis]
MADNLTTTPPAGRTERSMSTSSASSSGSWGGRRGTQGARFESLNQWKRKDDPALVARRQSFSEQRPAPGVFGKMWNTWVRGQLPAPK